MAANGTHTNGDSALPKAKDLWHHLSPEALSRRPSPLKTAFKYAVDPRIVSLGGGLPLPAYFPFEKITATAPEPPFLTYNDPVKSKDAPMLTVEVGRYNHEQDPGMIPLATAMQYGQSDGAPPLLNWIKEHTRLVHHPPYSNWGCLMTVGNTQGLDAALRLLTSRGDSILAEEYTFSSAMETAHAQGVRSVPVKVDLEGILPTELEAQLAAWEGPLPKFLYTIPTGQNPTGGTLSSERRKEVYKVLSKYDILIVEDEPYYFLQMDSYVPGASANAPTPPPTLAEDPQKHIKFLSQMVTSYLSLDIDGRVLRLDSFSKVMAPGTRLGWIVAQEPFIERLMRQNEVSIQTPAGFTQSIVFSLLSKWGQDGYLDWLVELRKEYTHRRNVCIDGLAEYFVKPSSFAPKGLTSVVEWKAPTAGMFFWLKFDARKHPKYGTLTPLEIEKEIYEAAIEHGVLFIPGSWFRADQDPIDESIEPADDQPVDIFFRGTFATVPQDKLLQGLKLFAETIATEFGLSH
ncbi:pyridoxal phosphate-dependent transferase [Lipomyces oligophaga]|uniref:pyridoxal phosphate-dependent transferase n=1 Tax=Lipomyces oligophaga TaxID=45792 RepID=UPI0034CFE424